MTSRFTGDYGLTPNEGNDFAVINLIAQMGDNPSNPKPAIEAIAVWLANRWSVYNLSDLQFLWHPETTESYGSDESYNIVTYPGYFTAVSKSQGVQIPNEFAQFDDGQATYYLGFKPNAQGKPTFGLSYANPRTRGVLREVALPLLALGSLAFDWSGTTGYAILGSGDVILGAAMAGEIATTIGIAGTQVALIVGSASIGSVTSGGDPIKAIENMAAAYVGAQAGNFVAGAVDSAAAGKIASAAVTAGARGQDVGQAILMAGAPLAAGAAAGSLTTGSKMGDLLFPGGSSTFDESVGYDWSLDPGDVVVSGPDLGIDVPITIPQEDLVTVLDPNALFPDDSGVLFNLKGEVVEYTADAYIQGIVTDRYGNTWGPDNDILLTKQEAIDAVAAGSAGCPTTGSGLNGATDFCQTPGQSIASKILEKVGPQSGQKKIPGPGFEDRKAETPPPNPNGVKMPDAVSWAAAAEAITKSAANVWAIINQVSNGTYRPGATSLYGTPRPPVPGIPVTNRDGSVVVNNGNGTQTVTYPNGTRTTMPVSVAGAGTGAFGGISTNTLLLAGAGLAALLLLRRK
jgi:hypothetical protein